MNQIIDTKLVSLAQQGDEAAFEQLINLSLNKLKAMLVNQYRLQPTDLEDIIQSASIKVFKKIGLFRNESSFTTWFYIILKNEALDCVRRRKIINSHEVSAHRDSEEWENEDYQDLGFDQIYEDTASSLLEKQETLSVYRKMIEQILDELTPSHKEIIQLSLNEDKSYREIADKLDIPIGTVMSRLFFARKNAQQLIIQYAKRNAIQLDCLG